MYLNPTGALTNPIADTGSETIAAGSSNIEWRFECMITIKTTGANGAIECDALYMSAQNAPAYAGPNVALSIDTTVDNLLELSAVAPGGSTFTLRQCSIEYLPTP